MNIFNFNYSMKNIPNYGKLQYQKALVNKTEHFIKRLRWKLFFIQNPLGQSEMQNFGFNTTKAPPQIKELKAFEEELFELIRNIKFKPFYNTFQNKLKKLSIIPKK